MPHRALFIAGAGTEIGKTYVTAALTRRLRGEGRAVLALKPLASGVPPLNDPAFAQSDTAVLLAAQGLLVTAAAVADCSPWRFAAPLAPDQAAAREGRSLTLGELVAWCEARLVEIALPNNASTSLSQAPPHPEMRGEAEPRRSPPEGAAGPGALLRGRFAAPQNEGEDRSVMISEGGVTVLIEGVGGLMSPVTAEATGLDWLKRLRLPALLVSGSYLGAISHALTAVETLRAHGVPLAGVAVSESEGAPTSPETVAEAIGCRVAAPVGVLHRGAPFPDALACIV